jgi:PST family polysaccharide transporter
MKKSPLRTITANMVSLSTIQAANYIVPLIMVPYLLRTIGTEKYGLFAFASAFGAYFPSIIDYGFNLTGTRDISRNRHDRTIVSGIVSEILSAKLFLFFISVLLSGLLIVLVPRLWQNGAVFCWSLVGAIGGSFIPVWFFQGKERMGPLALLSLFSKGLLLLGTVLFVKDPNDYLLVFYFSAVTTWIPALVGIAYVITQVHISLGLLPAKKGLRSGFNIFTTQFFAAVFNNSTIFVLGLFSNNATVALYAIAEKIVRAANCIAIPICSAVFPRAGFLFNQSYSRALSFLQKVLFLGGAGMGLVSVLLFLTADYSSAIVVGRASPESANLIRLLSMLPLSLFIDNLFGTQVLLNIGKERLLSATIAASSLLALLLLITLVPLFGPWGAAISYLCSEISVLFLFAVGLNRNGISVFLNLNPAFEKINCRKAIK